MLPIRDLNPTRRGAVLTLLLIMANVAMFGWGQPDAFRQVGQSTVDVAEAQTDFLYANAMVPCEITHLEPLSPELAKTCAGPAITDETGAIPYFPDKRLLVSVFASLFLHAGVVHLAGNMWFLWLFGNNVEDSYGAGGFALLYLIGGLVASAAHVAVEPSSIVPVIGASGAIAAVMGAYLVEFPSARIVTIVPPFFWWPFRLPAGIFLIEWFVLQFFTTPDSGVAWVAHVAGFIFGVVVALVRRVRSAVGPVSVAV